MDDLRKYVHGGKLGDLVFSIPAFLAGEFSEMLVHERGPVSSWSFRPEVILPLLEAVGIRAQVLCRGGVIEAGRGWVNGDAFRSVGRRWFGRPAGVRWNLAEKHLVAIGLSRELCWVPWLVVEPLAVEPVLFVRSSRYRPAVNVVDWREMVRWSHGRNAFVGLVEEWRAFCSEFNVTLPFLGTPDLLQAGRLLAGSRLVVTNQTGLHSVAEGLGCRILLERCDACDDCVFPGGRHFYSSGEFFRGPCYDECV